MNRKKKKGKKEGGKRRRNINKVYCMCDLCWAKQKATCTFYGTPFSALECWQAQDCLTNGVAGIQAYVLKGVILFRWFSGMLTLDPWATM